MKKNSIPKRLNVRRVVGLLSGAGGVGAFLTLFGSYFFCTGSAVLSEPIDVSGCIEVSRGTLAALIAWAKQNNIALLVTSISAIGAAIKLTVNNKLS